jgi:hypothetical protein
VMATRHGFSATSEVMGWDEASVAVDTDDPERVAREIAARGSELSLAPPGEDDLGHVVPAQPELAGYLVRPQTLLVVQHGEPAL